MEKIEGMEKEEQERINKIDNLLWEIAKILEPNEYIDYKKNYYC